jgi:hypothetical protein
MVYRSQEIVDLKITPEWLFARDAPALKGHGARQEIAVSGPYQTLANFAEGPPALVSLKRGLGHIYFRSLPSDLRRGST